MSRFVLDFFTGRLIHSSQTAATDINREIINAILFLNSPIYVLCQSDYMTGILTESRKGHFFFNIYQKRNRNKKNLKENQNKTITFKPLLIFPFQYIAEKKLKHEYWKGNQNKKYLVLST